MKKAGIFKKVSYEQYLKDWIRLYGEPSDENVVKCIWNKILLPTRSTEKSAGHDFYLPFGFQLDRGQSIVIPTGISCTCDDDIVLLIFPRSSLGFNYRVSMANTIPVIDADYCESDNEGHIMIKIVYDGILDAKPVTAAILNTTEDGFPNLVINNGISLGMSPTTIDFNGGTKFVQGILTNYFVADINDVTNTRNGGIGSTGVK